ncbi:MAG: site-specific integrase [Magnetospirillum sp.]|nr:site-specific integrase [Magnetospirillum sp.]
MMRGGLKSTKVRGGKLDSFSAREKLPARREPHWRAIEPGFALGYRRSAGKGGTWIARRYTSDGYPRIRYRALGAADDYAPADGTRVLTFAQAQECARAWLVEAARAEAGGVDVTQPYTVGDALDDYLSDYRTRGGRAEKETRQAIDVLIRPVLGSVQLAKLTHSQVKGFRDGLTKTGRRLRTQRGHEQKFKEIDINDPDQLRKRRATANRVFSTLRAALNHAHQCQHISSDSAWAAVKPFENTDAPRIRYLMDDEALRLVNACETSFRAILIAALLTGCRYGELIKMRVSDLNFDNSSIHIPFTKSGKPRDVALTDEGHEFFAQAVTGKVPNALVFLRSNGKPWKAAEQVRPLHVACEVAGIAPMISFHILRHTYASRLVRSGVPMAVIAAQLGHADIRVTSRHYAHLSPSYVADTVRTAFGYMGLNGNDL